MGSEQSRVCFGDVACCGCSGKFAVVISKESGIVE
jgi:hypothetical protein